MAPPVNPLTRATTKNYGLVMFALPGESTTGAAVMADDPRIRGLTPTTLPAHAANHRSGGSDALKLDLLAAPDDSTRLDASTTRHGLMSKADKVKLDAIPTGSFSVHAAVPGPGDGINGDTRLVLADLGIYNKSAGAWTLIGKLATVTEGLVRFITPSGATKGTEIAP